ncbi:Gfo/Idh/MocA family protein [Subtercola lobariae]|uniref:Inositol 2-dehydrogenase n=1 Tax=Subtercola lobariae TaxID=1588641 RepID=A0A917EU88_9MICO|nr:Gfo/Idh/MocA family oxidoreductase [Subtercola lobariae]GGF12831.1 inositol 2-dehydrogenase [Subtercola lobariae]
MIRIGMVGLGKMGLSHYSMVNAHPDVEVVAVCDSSAYLLGLLNRYTGVETFNDMSKMLAQSNLDAVIISTPSVLHAQMVKTALEAGVNVFCEKPFSLNPSTSRDLTELARSKKLVTQVGYHYRFVGAFKEVKRLLDSGAIGKVSHILAEAYGPVVLKPKGSTWRSKKSEGGGSLYDYAAHPIDLVNWYLGVPSEVRGTILGQVFSRETDDEVFSTMVWPDETTAQLSVSWSDPSQRKMSTKITVFGSNGRITADRQECQTFLTDATAAPEGYVEGWNVRYTTDLTDEVYFYVRGEEYSAQLDAFVKRIESGEIEGQNSFGSATGADEVLAMMVADANRDYAGIAAGPAPQVDRGLFRRRTKS